MVFLLSLVLFFLLWLGFAAIGAGMARRRHRDAALWGLICFFLPLLGIAILLIAGDAHGEGRGEGGAGFGHRDTNGSMWIRWQALIDVDPDIRAAASRVRAFGPQYEEQLAEKYLALNDKSALPALVARTLESAGYVEPQPPAQVEARPMHAPQPLPQHTERMQPPPVPPEPDHRAARLRHEAPENRPVIRPAKTAAPVHRAAAAKPVQGKIRNSVYQQNPDGTYTVVKGKHAGRSFKTFDEMRRTMR
jgi:hypothetical protein